MTLLPFIWLQMNSVFINLSAFFGAVWAILLFAHPRLLTILALLLSLVQLGWFTRYFGATAMLNRLTLVVIIILGFRVLLDILKKQGAAFGRQGIFNTIIALALSFIFLTFISNTYNNENILLGLYELRYYFCGLVFTFSLYLYFKEYLTIDLYIKSIVWVAIFQIPFSVIKWFMAGRGTTQTLDSVSGTFGGYGELVACQVLAIGFLLYEQFMHKKRILYLNNYILATLLTIPLLLSKSRTATALVLLIVVLIWLLTSIRMMSLKELIKKFTIALLLCTILFSLFYYYFWKKNYDLRQQFNFEYVINYNMLDPSSNPDAKDPKMGRFKAIAEAVRLISQHPFSMVLGYGSGSASEASFLGKTGRYFQSFGPLTGLNRNDFSKTIFEFGSAGIGLFIFFFLTVHRKLRFLSTKYFDLKDIYAIIIFCLLLLSSYTTTLNSYFFNVVLAFFFAVVQSESDKRVSIGYQK